MPFVCQVYKIVRSGNLQMLFKNKTIDRNAQKRLTDLLDEGGAPSLKIQISSVDITDEYNGVHFACDDVITIPNREDPDQAVVGIKEVDLLVPNIPPLNTLLIIFGNGKTRRYIRGVLKTRMSIDLDDVPFSLDAREQEVKKLFPGFRATQVSSVVDRYVSGGILSGQQLENSQDYQRFKRLGGELTGVAATYNQVYILLYKSGVIRSPNNFNSRQDVIDLVLEILSQMHALKIMQA